MEIPEIKMISDFETGMKCLQNPSLISGLKVSHVWKWGALFFAIFSSIITRIKLILIRFHAIKPSAHKLEEITEFTEDDSISLASSDEDDDRDKAEDGQMTSFEGVDDDYRVKGVFRCHWSNGNLRKRKRGPVVEFASGKGIVKLWDSLDFNLDFDEDLFGYGEQSVVSTWDCDPEGRGINFSRVAWGVPTAAPAAAVVRTAEGNRKGGGVILCGYDARMPRLFPALYAEWGSTAVVENVAGVATGGVGKVYVRDDVGGVVAVGDVRNVRRPLENVREFDGDICWDADDVIVDDK